MPDVHALPYGRARAPLPATQHYVIFRLFYKYFAPGGALRPKALVDKTAALDHGFGAGFTTGIAKRESSRLTLASILSYTYFDLS